MDPNANDDFDGKYSSLEGATQIYTQEKVDNIQAEILNEIDKNCTKKESISNISANRSFNNSDVGDTLGCNSSPNLTISSGFSARK